MSVQPRIPSIACVGLGTASATFPPRAHRCHRIALHIAVGAGAVISAALSNSTIDTGAPVASPARASPRPPTPPLAPHTHTPPPAHPYTPKSLHILDDSLHPCRQCHPSQTLPLGSRCPSGGRTTSSGSTSSANSISATPPMYFCLGLDSIFAPSPQPPPPNR